MNDESRETSIDLYGDGVGKVQLIQHYGDDKMVVKTIIVNMCEPKIVRIKN